MKRPEPAVFFLLFIASFALYLRTLAPSLLFGDSAEFQTIAHTLGVGHPTGYPVYVLLARLFTFLPAGTVAWRVNLFSAFCAALAVGLVYLSIRKLRARHTPAVFGAVSLAVTPLFWKHASLAEIYTCAAACLAFLLLAVLQWRATKNPRWLFGAGLLGGLSLGIHTTVALAAPAVLIYLMLSCLLSSSPGKRKGMLSGLYGLVLGTVIFLLTFLLIDALNSPAGYYNTVVRPSLSVWNMTPADFDSPFERLLFLYFPPQFKGQLFAVSSIDACARVADFALQASWGGPLALIGLVAMFIPRRHVAWRWREAIMLALVFATFLAFAVTYDVEDYYVDYLPAILVLAVLAAAGADAVIEVFAWIPGMPQAVPAAAGLLFLFALMLPGAGDLTASWQGRIPPRLQDGEAYLYQFPEARRLEAEKIVNHIEDNAIVFTDWDRVYTFYYVAHILQGRTDMDFHETLPQDDVTRFAASAVAYIESNIGSRPIYFSERPSQLAAQFRITRAGSGLFRIERK